jgi:hypothetical protein
MSQELGAELKKFDASKSGVVAGVILGALMIFGGIAFLWLFVRPAFQQIGPLPLFANPGYSIAQVVGVSLLSLVLILGGAGLIYGMRILSRTSVSVREQGLVVIDGSVERKLPWKQILYIRETYSETKVRVAGPVAAKRGSTDIVIECLDKKSLHFSEELAGFYEFLKLMREIAQQQKIKWSIDDFRSAARSRNPQASNLDELLGGESPESEERG